MAEPDGPSADGKARRGTFRMGAAQVDVCPEDAGYILSIGRTSIWLNTADALDVAQALARALEQEVVDGQPRSDEERATDEPSIAAILMPVKG